MRKLRVNVTADNIKEGKVGEPHHCPIALAIRDCAGDAIASLDQTEGFANVSVGWSTVSLRLQEQPLSSVTFITKDEADEKTMRDFVTAFDEGEPVEPVSFTIQKW